jgi:hypothetical protein
MRRDIEFNADGLTLRGWLYLPPSMPAARPRSDRLEVSG